MDRKKILLLSALVLAGLVLASVVAFGPVVLQSPREAVARKAVAAGYKALMMCSGVFVAGRTPDEVRAEELAMTPPRFRSGAKVEVDLGSRRATGHAAFGLVSRTAVYRDGLGCALMGAGAGEAEIAAIPNIPPPRPDGSAEDIPWPDGDGVTGNPTPAGVDAARLEALLESAFDGISFADPDKAWTEDTHTLGVVVIYKGEIVAERYREGRDRDTPYRIFSVAKSIGNALVGIRVGAGSISTRAPADFPAWQSPGDARGRVTVANLLHMSSGLTCGSGGGRSLLAYFGGGLNVVQEALSRQVEEPPGTRWCYGNFDSILLGYAVRQSLGGDLRGSLAFPYDALLNKIGMRSTVLETDVAGNYVISSQVWSTARDLARFGMLYLNDGMWNGERILPDGWVEFSRTRAPAYAGQVDGLGYGAQFWLVDRHPGIPAGSFSAGGSQGQYATIIPAHDAVIVRTGMMDWNQPDFVAEVLAALEPVAPSTE